MCAVLSATTLLTPSCAQEAPWPGAATAGPQPTYEKSVQLTNREATALSAVRDQNNQLDETAFYMLLEKAAAIAALGGEDPDAIDRPYAVNLLTNPERYRGWPVRLEVRILRVERLTAPEQMTPPPSWPADRAVYKMAGYAPSTVSGDNVSVLVFSTIQPQALGKPTRVGPDGEEYFDDQRLLNASGLFYKLYRSLDEDGNTQDFPVLIAWSVAPSQSDSKIAKLGNLGIIIAVALLIGYLFARRWARRATESESDYCYRPLREDLDERDERDAGKQVDPALLDATRQRDQQEESDSAADSQS